MFTPPHLAAELVREHQRAVTAQAAPPRRALVARSTATPQNRWAGRPLAGLRAAAQLLVHLHV